MSRPRRARGAEFVRLFAPLLETLRALGESGRPKEVSQKIAERIKIPEDELNRVNKNGESRFENQVAWARFYLAKAGLIDTSKRGVWTLTEQGRESNLDHEVALRIFREVYAKFRGTKEPEVSDEAQAPASEQEAASPDFRETITSLLRELTASGFERLCQRVLREIGFENVDVRGRSGDGGIDGVGVLRINPVIADRVVFQCKRYSSPVPPADVRDFRGAMQGRAHRAIFLATAKFSNEATREAAREGAAPIDLVDIDGLIVLLTEYGLGITTQTVHVVDRSFSSTICLPLTLSEVKFKVYHYLIPVPVDGAAALISASTTLGRNAPDAGLMYQVDVNCSFYPRLHPVKSVRGRCEG